MNPTVEFKVDGHSHLKEGEEMLLLSIRLLPSERGERKSIFFFSPERATATKGLLLRPLGRQKDSRSKYLLGPGRDDLKFHYGMSPVRNRSPKATVVEKRYVSNIKTPLTYYGRDINKLIDF